jgi:hypothetical protein
MEESWLQHATVCVCCTCTISAVCVSVVAAVAWGAPGDPGVSSLQSAGCSAMSYVCLFSFCMRRTWIETIAAG